MQASSVPRLPATPCRRPPPSGPPPLPVVVDGEQEWEAEEVLDSRRVRKRLQYLVKWKRYFEPTWEPEDYLSNAQAVEIFHERYTLKPAPSPPVGTGASQELST